MTEERIKVLLVDDLPENLVAIEALLRTPQIEFFKVQRGVDALELLLVHEFALAIVDVQMPEMDGYELAELMRGTERTRSVPIIFVTAGAQSRLSTFRGYEKGAVDFLYKPLDPLVVKSKVQVFLDLARQRRLLKLQLQETQKILAERDQALLEAREALRVRDEFMSIASHELKTPLTSLHLQLQIMNRLLEKKAWQEAVDKFRHGLEVCVRQSGKLSGLLDELLDLTRVRLGRLQLEKDWVDLAQVAREVAERFRPEAEKQGSKIELSVEEGVRGLWDPTRVDQITTNLVSNAIKYGGGGPIRVDARLRDGSAVLSVEDQGIGIPKEMQEKIFERFERAVPDGHVSGLGLGLYITRQIVEAHGGRVSVVSAEGKGSRFIVSLPLEAVRAGRDSA